MAPLACENKLKPRSNYIEGCSLGGGPAGHWVQLAPQPKAFAQSTVRAKAAASPHALIGLRAQALRACLLGQTLVETAGKCWNAPIGLENSPSYNQLYKSRIANSWARPSEGKKGKQQS